VDVGCLFVWMQGWHICCNLLVIDSWCLAVLCFSKTVSMRDKERLHDYRFMPEPNLPPLRLYTTETIPAGVAPQQIINVDELRDKMPEMPNEQRQRLCQTYGLLMEHSHVLVVCCCGCCYCLLPGLWNDTDGTDWVYVALGPDQSLVVGGVA